MRDLLATGYKDMGDEYFGRGRQGEAIEAYEEGMKWHMKAIYHAAVLEWYEEMQTYMELFWELEAETSKLNDIALNRREIVVKMARACEVFVEMNLGEM